MAASAGSGARPGEPGSANPRPPGSHESAAERSGDAPRSPGSAPRGGLAPPPVRLARADAIRGCVIAFSFARLESASAAKAPALAVAGGPLAAEGGAARIGAPIARRGARPSRTARAGAGVAGTTGIAPASLAVDGAAPARTASGRLPATRSGRETARARTGGEGAAARAMVGGGAVRAAAGASVDARTGGATDRASAAAASGPRAVSVRAMARRCTTGAPVEAAGCAAPAPGTGPAAADDASGGAAPAATMSVGNVDAVATSLPPARCARAASCRAMIRVESGPAPAAIGGRPAMTAMRRAMSPGAARRR